MMLFMVRIKLRDEELRFLRGFVKKGQKSARELTRARILLLANRQRRDTEIAEILEVGRNTVWRIKKRYCEEGLQSALVDKPRPGQPRKYTRRHEAEIIALACSSPPWGRRRWTIQLLVEEARKKPGLETLNRESVKKKKKKHGLSLG